MTDSREALSEPAKGLSQDPRSVAPGVPDAESVKSANKTEPLVGQAASSVRAPRPANLTWTQLQELEKDQTAGFSATGFGALDSGPVSPISPISSSEALRTPNALDRHKSHKHPPSPGNTSQLPPRLHSPASQIFERNVQEDILPAQTSPSIPAHIRTENYIPPVLEASSAAITDEQLDPDSVEIVTHSLHQPAASGVTGVSTADQSLSSSGIVDHAGAASTDSEAHIASDTDVRRLSFISFADVVNAEHAETGDSVYSQNPSQGAVTSAFPPAASFQNRSPSPLRSPASSHGLGTSPPTSIATSVKGLEMSPKHGTRRTGSPFPLAQSPVSSHFGGDLNVETMRQALRRTGSGDLGVSSPAASAIGNDETLDRSL